MVLSRDVYTLVTKGIIHAINKDVVREVPHVVHDVLLGARISPKDPGFIRYMIIPSIGRLKSVGVHE